MRVLVISRSAWRSDNNTGNTLTDFFMDMPDMEIFSLCMREQLPQNCIARQHLYISEKQMLKKLLGKKATIVAEHTSNQSDDGFERAMYDAAKKHPGYLLHFAREILWSLSDWNDDLLKKYIQAIHPDVLFFPTFGCYYPHKVLCYLHMLTDARIVVFHADDHYTLNQFSLSPLFWLYRFGLRKWMRHTVSIADLQYCISQMQKADYDKAFGCSCKVLTKFADFSGKPLTKDRYGVPLQLVFTGNIGMNRWKSLKIIADVLKMINKDAIRAQLRIYTATPLTGKMKRALQRGESSFLMGSVPGCEVQEIQKNADMLVHVEALDLKNRLAVRHSFSTKIVDYLKAARPILAVGPRDVASIDHLVRNDCAIVADNKVELERKLRSILEDPSELNRVTRNAYECGRKYHNKRDVQSMLLQDLKTVCGK